MGYYRSFISHFATKAKPLFALLKKDVPFIWSSECKAAMQYLKEALTSDPVLQIPSADGSYVLYTDWSMDGISAILH